jgi:uncharacterized protein
LKILVAGGSGFIGRALVGFLHRRSHEVWILTRRPPNNPYTIQWDGESTAGWGDRVAEMDAVVNLTGHSLEHWPWTKLQKQRFRDSRVLPGRALVSAIRASARRPRVFLQISGINYYGLRGKSAADESTPAAGDYLARLTVAWEEATRPVEDLGLRRVIARSAVVLDSSGGMFPLMSRATRFFLGGPLGDGGQAVPWIHLADELGALSYLLENERASGPFNLIAPQQTSNAEFMHAVAKAMHRPYWIHAPTFFLGALLGEMSDLVLEGRYSQPRRLLDLGYQFQFPILAEAVGDIVTRALDN